MDDNELLDPLGGREEALSRNDLEEIEKLNQAYEPFPDFEEWNSCKVDTETWEKEVLSFKELSKPSTDLLARAIDEVKRAAAVETGVIEELYESDRGLTITAGVAAAVWESRLEAAPPKQRALIQAQLEAYERVLDLATTLGPFPEAWIRSLHEVICKSQETYTVVLPSGETQQQRLERGNYKRFPNHVIKSDGTSHSYAPVLETPHEMTRLMRNLGSTQFLNAHPVLQASYAHYALVVIHPFADGNGRVARALASVFICRAIGTPVLIANDQVADYYGSLAFADAGDFQPFVDFIAKHARLTMELITDSMATAKVTRNDSGKRIRLTYKTKGGYFHHVVDSAVHSLSKIAQEALMRWAEGLSEEDKGLVNVLVKANLGTYLPYGAEMRTPINPGPSMIMLRIATPAPGEAEVIRRFGLAVPKSALKGDSVQIQSLDGKESLLGPLSQLVPTLANHLLMRTQLWASRVMEDALSELAELSKASLEKKGY